MPEQPKVTKATLTELEAPDKPTSYVVTVQFNPETLKVSYANQIVPPGNEAAANSGSEGSTQFVGKGTTKLSVQLWFDVSSVLPEGKKTVTDVRDLTKEVIYFITPKDSVERPGQKVPPGIRFVWGSFQFDGIVESLEESLEFFSNDGRPLRASISLSMSQQRIEVLKSKNPTGGASGTRPLSQAAAGDSVQGMAAKLGRADDWQAIAAANNIENPRLLPPGQLIDMNAAPARPRGGK